LKIAFDLLELVARSCEELEIPYALAGDYGLAHVWEAVRRRRAQG
jgi:hypothetical protein